MTIIKPLLAMLIASIRKELTIQKPEVSVMRSRKQHKPGDAAKGVMLIIIAPIIFVILAGLIL
jgi:hypothetical protein